MILHVSLPADDCEIVARTLAELVDGRALPFPPGGPTAWNVWSKDERVQIGVTPRGAVMVPGPAGVEWTQAEHLARAAESHLAVCVDRSAAELVAIAERAGWPARIFDRGGFFHVVEVWIEGAYLIELLDPSFTEEYARSMNTANWCRVFGLPAPGDHDVGRATV